LGAREYYLRGRAGEHSTKLHLEKIRDRSQKAEPVGGLRRIQGGRKTYRRFSWNGKDRAGQQKAARKRGKKTFSFQSERRRGRPGKNRVDHWSWGGGARDGRPFSFKATSQTRQFSRTKRGRICAKRGHEGGGPPTKTKKKRRWC